MAFAVIAETGVQGGSSGGTTGSIDTTGANLIVAGCPLYIGGSGTMSDSKGGTWTALTLRQTGSGDNATQLFWCVPSSVGSGHTFDWSGSNIFGGPSVIAFSGAHASPYDQESGALGAGTSVQPGSITPPDVDYLFVTSVSMNSSTDFATAAAIDQGFTITRRFSSGVNGTYAHGLAYLIHSAGTARNPTWSWTASVAPTVAMATFAPAAGGGGLVIPVAMAQYRQRWA